MTRTIFWIMALNLLRDRGALISTFILPAAVYIVFAVIFSGTTGGEIDVKLAVLDEVDSPQTRRMIEFIENEPGIRRVEVSTTSTAVLHQIVKDAEADVGVIIENPSNEIQFRLLFEPARKISQTILEGALTNAYFKAFPDTAISTVSQLIDEKIARLSPEQEARIKQATDSIRDGNRDSEALSVQMEPTIERINILGDTRVKSGVSYYAGAVAIMFLLFSSVNGAASILEERQTGLFERLALGPGDTYVIVNGKYLFLLVQGGIQVSIIFLVAWLIFGVPLMANFVVWALVTILAAAATSAIALAFVIACRTLQQAQTMSNVIILIMSAIGGSMVPRFLMPDWIQNVGWLTPNTWVLEAYGAILWRGEGPGAIVIPCAILSAVTFVGLCLAHILARAEK